MSFQCPSVDLNDPHALLNSKRVVGGDFSKVSRLAFSAGVRGEGAAGSEVDGASLLGSGTAISRVGKIVLSPDDLKMPPPTRVVLVLSRDCLAAWNVAGLV